MEKEEGWRRHGAGFITSRAGGEDTTHYVEGECDEQLFVHRKPSDGKRELEAVEGGMPQENRKAAGECYDQIDCWKKCLGGHRFVFAN